jgi:hypothetical protein
MRLEPKTAAMAVFQVTNCGTVPYISILPLFFALRLFSAECRAGCRNQIFTHGQQHAYSDVQKPRVNSNIHTRATKLSSSMCTRACKSRVSSQNSVKEAARGVKTVSRNAESYNSLFCFPHPHIGIFHVMSRHSAKTRLRLV